MLTRRVRPPFASRSWVRFHRELTDPHIVPFDDRQASIDP